MPRIWKSIGLKISCYIVVYIKTTQSQSEQLGQKSQTLLNETNHNWIKTVW